jgi:Ca-activated chloride channel family protein
LTLLLVFAAQKVCAQLAPADDFFNSGAQFYISNNIPAAKERAESGLQIYPDDVKLKKLEELLKQQQQSQNSQSQQNQQQQNNQQSQQQKSDSQKSQQQNQESSQKKSQDQQKQDEKNQSGQKQDNQNAENQAAAAGQMTPEEAKKLLDAQKGDEQVLQLKPQGKPQDPNRPVKDW